MASNSKVGFFIVQTTKDNLFSTTKLIYFEFFAIGSTKILHLKIQ